MPLTALGVVFAAGVAVPVFPLENTVTACSRDKQQEVKVSH